MTYRTWNNLKAKKTEQPDRIAEQNEEQIFNHSVKNFSRSLVLRASQSLYIRLGSLSFYSPSSFGTVNKKKEAEHTTVSTFNNMVTTTIFFGRVRETICRQCFEIHRLSR